MVEDDDIIVDFGSFKQFNIERCTKEKLDTLVVDEAGLDTPISVSVVIPTKLDITLESELELEHEALHKVLSECSELVDKGYIDEIIVIDATMDDKKQIDYSTLRNVTEIAYEELGLFREQIKIIKKYLIEREKAKKGFFPFVFKAVHQFDQNIEKVLAHSGVINYTKSLRILSGKGSGLWLSIPICQGDVITFIDSDIMNFQKEFIIGLVHPLVYSWNEITNEPSVKMIKSYYNRLTISRAGLRDKCIIGGRITRLFMIPLIKLLVKKFQIHEGFGQIKYPLSGEIAASRSLLETFDFPNNYAVETSHLFQAFDILDANSIGLTNLEQFFHIGQASETLYEMANQILHAFKKYLPKRVFKKFITPQFVNDYETVARNIVKENQEKVIEQVDEINESSPFKTEYSVEKDFQRINDFKKVLLNYKIRNNKNKKSYNGNTIYLPSWNFLKEKTKNWDFIRRMLGRRSVQSTYSRLKELEIVI
ncbi:MAG: hypothetical protein GF329_08095 [Candidatus Lokiarchaeota archaeon]|nr:hypothetical protein [Candidatus Lokiarchaeota archaeon]